VLGRRGQGCQGAGVAVVGVGGCGIGGRMVIPVSPPLETTYTDVGPTRSRIS
jgi:hypothetical protein